VAEKLSVGDRRRPAGGRRPKRFLPRRGLAVPRGDEIVPLVNRLAQRFEHVVLTQDWHPRGHQSFASTHPGRKPYETITVAYGPQILWPDHCVQGTAGAEFRNDLQIRRQSSSCAKVIIATSIPTQRSTRTTARLILD